MNRKTTFLIFLMALAFCFAAGAAHAAEEVAKQPDAWQALYVSIAGAIGDGVKLLLAALFAFVLNKLKGTAEKFNVKIDEDQAMAWATRGAAFAEREAAKLIEKRGEDFRPKSAEKLASAHKFIDEKAPKVLRHSAKELIEAALPFVLERAKQAIENLRKKKLLSKEDKVSEATQ